MRVFHFGKFFADLLQLRMLVIADLDEHAEHSEPVLLVEGVSSAVVLGVVVDDVDLGVVGGAVDLVLAASSFAGAPVGVDLNNLKKYSGQRMIEIYSDEP